MEDRHGLFFTVETSKGESESPSTLSPAECKGHYSMGTLALGLAGAAGSTYKGNFKQKTHKGTSSDENLNLWTVEKL